MYTSMDSMRPEHEGGEPLQGFDSTQQGGDP
jgi:hypothetical protein